MYECSICQSLNHASRYQCQNCGTIPAQYSMTGKPMKYWSSPVDSLGMPMYIHVVVAQGAVRANHSRTTRVVLKTVTLDYYGEA